MLRQIQDHNKTSHMWRKLQKYSTACLNFKKWIQYCNIIYINYISCHIEIPSISFISRQHSVTLSPAKFKCFWNAIYSVAVILMEKNMTALNITRLKKKEYWTDYPLYGHVHQPEEKKDEKSYTRTKFECRKIHQLSD